MKAAEAVKIEGDHLADRMTNRRTGHYHNPNLKLVMKVWIPVAFLMRLAMKKTLEKKKFQFFSNMGHQLAMPF
jgi:hypothetical protein